MKIGQVCIEEVVAVEGVVPAADFDEHECDERGHSEEEWSEDTFGKVSNSFGPEKEPSLQYLPRYTPGFAHVGGV